MEVGDEEEEEEVFSMSEHKSLLLLLFSSFRHVAFPSSSFCRNGYSSLGVPLLRAVAEEEEILRSSFPQPSPPTIFYAKIQTVFVQ